MTSFTTETTSFQHFASFNRDCAQQKENTLHTTSLPRSPRYARQGGACRPLVIYTRVNAVPAARSEPRTGPRCLRRGCKKTREVVLMVTRIGVAQPRQRRPM